MSEEILHGDGANKKTNKSVVYPCSPESRQLSTDSPYYDHAVSCLQKMYSNLLSDQLTDVVLLTQNVKIPAHRIVLCAASDYFSSMFTSNLKETSQREVHIPDVDPEILRSLVQYAYTGTIELSEETVESIMSAANLFLFKNVVKFCSDYMEKLFHPSNCIGICDFADKLSCLDLKEKCQNYIFDNFLEVVKHQEFLELNHEAIVDILNSINLNVSSEEEVFNAAMQWLKCDLSKRASHINNILKCIRWPFLSPSFIVDTVESDELLQDNLLCRDIVSEAFVYHLLPERRSQLKSAGTFPRNSTVGGLYAIGGSGEGEELRSIEIFNFRHDKWTHFGEMTRGILQFGSVADNGKIYIVGGRNGLKSVDTFECYDVKRKSWTLLRPLRQCRHGLGVAILNGYIYAVGGFDGWSYLNSVERWNMETGAWDDVGHMATHRSTHGLAVLDGLLYAVGGRNGRSCLQSMECYDPQSNTWRTLNPMHYCRGNVGVGVLHGFLYAVGGIENTEATSVLGSVERYDPAKSSWTTIASLNNPRYGIGVCLFGERLFAVGGYFLSYFKSVEAYDCAKDEWENVSPMNTARAGACVVVIKP